MREVPICRHWPTHLPDGKVTLAYTEWSGGRLGDEVIVVVDTDPNPFPRFRLR